MSKIKTIPIGTKVGRLVVIGPGEPAVRYGRKWSTSICECQCEDHNVVTVLNNKLTCKRPILSCGCANYDKLHKVVALHLPRISKGYRYVYAPQSENASGSESYKGYAFEHRIVAEHMLGRCLRKDEDVHHIDFNPLNNEECNLIVLSKHDHQRLHGMIKANQKLKEIAKSNEGIRKILSGKYNRKCVDCGVELNLSIYNKKATSRCLECSRIHSRKVGRPKIDVLVRDINKRSYSRIGKDYGVTVNTVKKWLRRYGICKRQLVFDFESK